MGACWNLPYSFSELKAMKPAELRMRGAAAYVDLRRAVTYSEMPDLILQCIDGSRDFYLAEAKASEVVALVESLYNFTLGMAEASKWSGDIGSLNAAQKRMKIFRLIMPALHRPSGGTESSQALHQK